MYLKQSAQNQMHKSWNVLPYISARIDSVSDVEVYLAKREPDLYDEVCFDVMDNNASPTAVWDALASCGSERVSKLKLMHASSPLFSPAPQKTIAAAFPNIRALYISLTSESQMFDLEEVILGSGCSHLEVLTVWTMYPEALISSDRWKSSAELLPRLRILDMIHHMHPTAAARIIPRVQHLMPRVTFEITKREDMQVLSGVLRGLKSQTIVGVRFRVHWDLDLYLEGEGWYHCAEWEEIVGLVMLAFTNTKVLSFITPDEFFANWFPVIRRICPRVSLSHHYMVIDTYIPWGWHW